MPTSANMSDMKLIDYLRDEGSMRSVAENILRNLDFYRQFDTAEKVDALSGKIYNWFVSECVEKNQYLFITDRKYTQLHDLYRNLVIALGGITAENSGEKVLELVRQHRQNLVLIIEAIDGINNGNVEIIPCAEYSAALQLKVLRVDATMMQPVLDIGCGKKHHVIDVLSSMGIEALGIDQFQSDEQRILRRNWLDFGYGSNKWGCILSHMAFSNHYIRNLHRRTDLLPKYRVKYNEIVRSLKRGGLFAYCPAIPEMEERLDKRKFKVDRFQNIHGQNEFNTTHVIRTA